MALTPAPAPPAQTPAPGATAPAAATKAPDAKKESRFNRGKLVEQTGNPLETTLTVNSKRYPLELGESDEYPHWVVFYPLTREGTKSGQELLKSGKGVIFDQSDQNRADPQNNVSAALVAGAVAGFTAGAASGLGDLLKSNGGNVVNQGSTKIGGPVSMGSAKLGKVFGDIIKGTAVGGAYGAASGAVAGEQRLVFGQDEIVLHIPDKVASGYSANWETADLGGLVGAVASGKMSADSLFNKNGEFDAGAAMSSGGELGDYALRKLGKVASIAGFDNISNVVAATSKKVENPYKEQLFRSMGFRKFAFDYRFSPKSEQEAEEIFGKDGIIQTFSKHMHPTRSQNGLFLTYPSEFLIIYYHNGEENNYIKKISNCALTDMNLEYGAEGFTTFSNGCPSEVVIRLVFTELETLTTDRIEQGF
jgi:hypothetical protein